MGREKEGGRPTYGDAVVAGEPDSYKLPYEEAKSCWEDRGWGRERGQGQDTQEKWGVKRENKEGAEEEGREGKSLKTMNRVCTPSANSQWSHIFREKLTYNGEDERVGEIVVERQFHVVLSLTQRSLRGHERRQDVERLSRN